MCRTLPTTVVSEESYFQRSHEFREELEEEHALVFVEERIGPGADWPAFLGWLSMSPVPYLAGALALFFAGRRIEENFDAWLRMGVRLSRFFRYNARFDKGGAAITAISAILAPGSEAQIESGPPSPTAPDAGAVAGRKAAAEGEFNGEQGSQVASSPPLRLRPGSKQALLVDRLSSGDGCTLDELVKLLGWQRHTVRAALTGLRQKGYRIAKSKSAEGETRYHAFSWPKGPS